MKFVDDLSITKKPCPKESIFKEDKGNPCDQKLFSIDYRCNFSVVKAS